MGTLIKVTSTPFQSIRFTQSARLVPSHAVAAERQRVMSLYLAHQARYHVSGRYPNVDFMNQYRQAFPSDAPVTVASQSAAATQEAPSVPVIKQIGSYGTGPVTSSGYSYASSADYVSMETGEADDFSAASAEPLSEYLVQREAFEFRMANGEVSYIPAMSVTIVTQYPEVHFEYLGDFNYVPPRKDAKGDLIDIQA